MTYRWSIAVLLIGCGTSDVVRDGGMDATVGLDGGADSGGGTDGGLADQMSDVSDSSLVCEGGLLRMR